MNDAAFYRVEVQDISVHLRHPNRVVLSEDLPSPDCAKDRADHIRTVYHARRYQVTYQVDDNGPCARKGDKRWLHLVTQRFTPAHQRRLREKASGRPPITLPYEGTPTVDVRRFFWKLVRARSRRQRKFMANTLTVVHDLVPRTQFQKAWDGAQYSGPLSMLDSQHRVYRDITYLKPAARVFILTDEAQEFILGSAS